MTKHLSRRHYAHASVRDDADSLDNVGVTLRAPAKINLSLVVMGPRPDGFHDLHTIMATVDFYDDLTVKLSDTEGVHLVCTGISCPPAGDNLVHKAAVLLARQAGITPAVEIHLHKRIPSGAGLGGASSDAAACLMALNRLWQLGYSRRQLSQLAQKLGSDVPFFLYAPVALCTKRGEVVKALPHRCNRSILLIMPNIHVPTPEVFKNYCHDDDLSQDYMRRVSYFLRSGDLNGLIIQQINSLAQTCMQLYEPLRDFRAELLKAGISPLQISGSGSSLFASSEFPEQIDQWQKQLEKHDFAQVRAVSFHNQSEPFLEVHHADF